MAFRFIYFHSYHNLDLTKIYIIEYFQTIKIIILKSKIEMTLELKLMSIDSPLTGKKVH